MPTTPQTGIPSIESDDPLLEKSYQFALQAHAEQKRIHGDEYIVHPVNVFRLLSEFTDDRDLLSAALLHDVLEDTRILKPELEAVFGERITRIVDTLSKKPGETMTNYLRSLRAQPREIRLVKVIDRLHNVSEVSLTKMRFFIHRTLLETTRYIYPLCWDLPSPLFERLRKQVEDLKHQFGCGEISPALEHVKLIGLLGGLACGKSTLLNLLAKEGYTTLDANDLSDDAYKVGSSWHRKLVNAFGTDFVDPVTGDLNRSQLRCHVFGKSRYLQKYANTLHPYIDERVWETINASRSIKDDMIFYGSAIMIKTGESRCMDYNIFMRTSPPVQIARLMERDGISRAQAENIIKAQYNINRVIDNSDFILKTDGQIDSMIRRFRLIVENIKTLSP